MVTRFSALFSIAAICKVMGCVKSQIKKVEEWGWILWIHIAGRSPRFVSKKAFYGIFGEARKQRSQGINIKDDQSLMFGAFNPTTCKSYKVSCFQSRIICTCEDYKNISHFAQTDRKLAPAPCKHGYAVLGHLGFGSMADYLKVSKRIDWFSGDGQEPIRCCLDAGRANL